MTDLVFDLDQQRAFASASGDWNPLHVDPLEARRLLFGEAVVHGVHLVLCAMEAWLQNSASEPQLTGVQASFWRPLPLGRAVQLAFEDRGVDVRVEAQCDGFHVATITFRKSRKVQVIDAPEKNFSVECPDDPQIEVDMRGQVAAGANSALAVRFPMVASRVGTRWISALSAATRVVGMQCPGQHSVFSSLDLTAEGDAASPLHWRVASFRKAVGQVALKVKGAGVQGVLKAFLRPPPREQKSFAEVAELVADDEFAGRRALVVGGSRGLGEITVKILAAGGAAVQVGWSRGELEAQRIVTELSKHGRTASMLHWDVTAEGPDGVIDTGTTDLYYFATPPLNTSPPGKFHRATFDRYTRFYVTGFDRVVARVREASPALCRVWYPSSVAVSDPPAGLVEYAAAKAAGEVLCVRLRATGLEVAARRLPRMETDLVASVRAIPSAPAVPTMLAALAGKALR